LNGYFGACHHIAQEDADFVVHLGDFIYESARGEFTGAGSEQYPAREISFPSGESRPRSITDYRHLYRTYRSDRFLREALENHTLIATWDDHEFFLDLFWDRETNAPSGDHPERDNPGFMRTLAADALQAWWEYTPTRIDYDPAADALHDRFQLWRTFEFGDLAKIVFTDERLYRDEPHGRDHVPIRRVMGPDHEPEGQTMLGEDQREWFLDEVESSEKIWTVWANEVLTVPAKLGAGPLTFYPTNTGWDGYQRERKQIFQTLAEEDVSNFVTLSGDMHCYLAGYQQTTYDNSLRRLLTGSSIDPSKRVGVEFMTPPVTSLNFAETVGMSDGWRGRLTSPLLSWSARWQNPHLEFFDSHHWGYSIVEITPEVCTYTAYAVDKTTDSATAEKTVLARLQVPEGRTVIEDVTEQASLSNDGRGDR
ncbi:MAG: alkaline phosphatase, partial [Halorhabdus sp.]